VRGVEMGVPFGVGESVPEVFDPFHDDTADWLSVGATGAPATRGSGS
jgi:hypothetical protein